ncbi:MAG: hypothetical protein ACYCUG_16240 [Acidimicrobiales bacterium]
MRFGAELPVLRISVNAGASLGGAGIETNLPPSMTVGTGYAGGSSVGENLQPAHLVQWTRCAFNADPAEAFADFAGLSPWCAPGAPQPPYPRPSNLGDAPPLVPTPAPVPDHLAGLRAEIRRVVLEELSALRGG